MAFTIYLEVEDIQRCPTIKHFWSCRLVPGAADAADRHRHRRSKDGNRYLKLAFSHAAVRAVQYFPEVRSGTSGGNGRSRSRSPARWSPRNSRRVSITSSRTQSVYHVLQDDVDFNQQFKGTPLTRQKAARWPRRASPSVSLSFARSTYA